MSLFRKTQEPRIRDITVPPSLLVMLVGPILIPTYLTVAFSRLDVEEGKFEQDLFPVAAMWMYWRVDDSPRNVKRLETIRTRLDHQGSVWPIPKRVPSKKRKRR